MMTKKRILSIFITIAMVFGMLTTSFAAETQKLTLEAEKVEISHGTKTASVKVNLKNNPGIAALGFDIGYDSGKMTLTSISNNTDVFSAADVTTGDIEKNPYTYSAMNANENKTGNGLIMTLNFSIADNCPVGTYPITISKGEAYSIDENAVDTVLENGSIKVCGKTFKGITYKNAKYTYDGTEKKLAVSGTLPTGAKVVYTNEKGTNAGTYDATAKITCDGYDDLTLNATLTINPKSLTITGLSAQSKTYDGTDKATLSDGVLNGKISGDDVTAAIPTGGKFSDKNVGKNKNVAIDNIALTGAKAGNYTLTQPTGLKANITQKEISVTAHNQQMIKNGAMPELTYTADKLCDGDSFTGNLATKANGTKLGKFDITQGTLTAGNNYKIKYTKGILEVSDKTPQTITVADFDEKTYGDTAFAITVTPDATSTLSNFTYASDNEKVATISATGEITIVGAGEANITVTEPGNSDYAQAIATKKLTVSKKAVTVNSIDLDSKTAVLDGVLEADKDAATLDFDKITLTIGDAVDETTSNAVITNFALKGDKAGNYNITTESLNATIANENVITVTITAENGTATGAAKYLKGAEVTVVATPNSGYKFSGWYNGDTAVSTCETYTFKAESDISLVAKFKKRSTGGGGGSSAPSSYTVKFETNDGGKIDSVNVDKNDTVAEPKAPTKDGFEFAGWYTDKDFTNEFDFNTRITKNITLYAKWLKSEYVPDSADKPTEPTKPENKITFTDVKDNDWFCENVKYVIENGLMNGVSETEFAPNDNLTRAMLVAILYRAAGEPAVNKSVPFADVAADSYYANAVIWAQQNGIVSGVNENEFAPDENITREQIATIIYRYAKAMGYDISAKAEISAYADANEISEYATEAMQYAVGAGLIKGKTETTLNPKDNATRAEIAAILQRFIEGDK